MITILARPPAHLDLYQWEMWYSMCDLNWDFETNWMLQYLQVFCLDHCNLTQVHTPKIEAQTFILLDFGGDKICQCHFARFC